jgi:hypothetical protein
MAKTGESYTTARSHLATHPSGRPDPAGDPDASALARALAAAGVLDPRTGRPFTDSLLFGIGGGIGFAYLVFAYPGWTTVHVDGRFNGLYFEKKGFVETACARLGVPVRVQQLTTPELATRRLREALDVTPEVVLTLDLVRLPGFTPPVPAPYFPHHVTVRDDARELTVAGLSGGPVTVPWGEVVEARWTGAKKYGGLFLIGARPDPVDVDAVVHAAAARTVECLLEPDRSSFDGNFGVGGIRRWARLLTDPRDPKGWPKLFADPESTHSALASVVDGLRRGDPAGTAARWLYAAFLEEAGLGAAAGAYRELGRRWAALAEVAGQPGATGTDLAALLPDLAEAEQTAAGSLRAALPAEGVRR